MTVPNNARSAGRPPKPRGSDAMKARVPVAAGGGTRRRLPV